MLCAERLQCREDTIQSNIYKKRGRTNIPRWERLERTWFGEKWRKEFREKIEKNKVISSNQYTLILKENNPKEYTKRRMISKQNTLLKKQALGMKCVVCGKKFRPNSLGQSTCSKSCKKIRRSLSLKISSKTTKQLIKKGMDLRLVHKTLMDLKNTRKR